MRAFRVTKTLALSTLLISLLVMGTLAQQSASTFSDTFHSTTLDSAHWTVNKFNVAGNVSATDQGLQLTLTQHNVNNFFAETVWLKCRIHGDFSAQVDFRLVDWPTNNGIRLGLGVRPDALPIGTKTLNRITDGQPALGTAIAERKSPKLGTTFDSDPSSGGDVYLAEFNSVETVPIPVVRTSGKLRVARAQDQFTAFYWDGKLWVPLGFWSPTILNDEWVALQLWGFGSSPNIQIFFENFSLTAGTLNCS